MKIALFSVGGLVPDYMTSHPDDGIFRTSPSMALTRVYKLMAIGKIRYLGVPEHSWAKRQTKYGGVDVQLQPCNQMEVSRI
jgi:hypothetical protein